MIKDGNQLLAELILPTFSVDLLLEAQNLLRKVTFKG